MIHRQLVNQAMIQQAAEELEIGVPIRSWSIDEGKLILHLAYGGRATWAGPAGTLGDETGPGGSGSVPSEPGDPVEPERLEAPHSGREYYWTERLHDEPIPEGDLSQRVKDELAAMAYQVGLRYVGDLRLYKADYVDILTELREKERGG